MLNKLTKFSEKSRIFCPNFVSKLQNHQPKPIFESWTNPRKNWNPFNENSKRGRIWKVINQKFSSTKRKLDRKYWKINQFSMKNFQINFRKHWFTDVKPISKNRDKKSFPSKFKDFVMEMKRHWIPKNFEFTFFVFFHHNVKEIYHLVRVTNLKSLQFLKSPLFIRFKGWLWKMLVFEFVRSKGYPFTKNRYFLIILIKIRQYPWDFILEKIHDFQRNF